jgi:hypothetical protein
LPKEPGTFLRHLLSWLPSKVNTTKNQHEKPALYNVLKIQTKIRRTDSYFDDVLPDLDGCVQLA